MQLAGAALALVLVAGAAPGGWGPAPAARARLTAVTSTTILADLVRRVAGERWDVKAIVPVGADPHAYQATPGDARRLASADLVVLVGAGLETPALEKLVRSAAKAATVLKVAPALGVVRDGEGTVEAGSAGDEHGHGGEVDPHVWWSVPLTIRLVEEVEAALERVDPEGAPVYRTNLQGYTHELQRLDGWIREQVAAIPPDRRLLATNHGVLGYFAREYGFCVVGEVLPGTSSLAEASAADTARLVTRLKQLRVPAIFAETTVSPVLAARVSREAGVRLVTLYTDSLGPEGSGAETYVGFMKTNVGRIVEALRGG